MIYCRMLSLFMLTVIFLAAQGQGIDEQVLKTIIQKGKESHSNAVIIIQNGNVVKEEYYGQEPKPEYISSAGKSLVSLAIGQLIDSGKIKSLDQPVCEFYPEWKQGQKKNITIRMLLNHTSGLQNILNASVELEPAPKWKVKDVIQLALCAEISDTPGKVFEYNNKAVALLGGIIEKASGMRMDIYFEKGFFAPMHIKDAQWIRDEAGNPTAHGAFIIKPMDLAKFGLLVLNKGRYGNKQIISEKWIDQSLNPDQDFDMRFGLLWWRLLKVNKRVITQENIEVLRTNGIDTAILKKLQPLVNDTLSENEYNSALSRAFSGQLGPNWFQIVNSLFASKNLSFTDNMRKLIQSKEAVAYYANGYRGNFLVIVPSLNLVAVRVKGNNQPHNYETDNFTDFVELVTRLSISK
jgi:CubicO group peptidase (beta-lactamase class C family)